MTLQLKITENGDGYGDLNIDSGGVQWISGNDSIIQHIKSRLSFQLGTFEIYPESGTDYFAYVLGNKNKKLASEIIKRVILETPDVKSLIEFNYDWDNKSRNLTITFRFNSLYGTSNLINIDLFA